MCDAANGYSRRASFVGKDGKKYTWRVGQKSLEVG